LALHACEHKNYSTLGQQEQKKLYKSNERIQIVFEKRSDIIIPPNNKFNTVKLMAIKKLGIRILSSSIEDPYKFDQRSSIFLSYAKKNSRVFHQIYFFTVCD
jgi:peptidoglycan/xylan/chitin deacetylase (PgdA/CDA1 family)